jgi:hypothetical protein
MMEIRSLLERERVRETNPTVSKLAAETSSPLPLFVRSPLLWDRSTLSLFGWDGSLAFLGRLARHRDARWADTVTSPSRRSFPPPSNPTEHLGLAATAATTAAN